MKRTIALIILLSFVSIPGAFAADTEIEKQLEDIGRIQNEEVVVVQRKYTRKIMRHEFTPVMFGGIPFGTVRRTLFGGAAYTLHINDWFAVSPLDFAYTKTFFSSFTDDINTAPGNRPGQRTIVPDVQRLQYFLTGGFQFTPFYGKASSLSRWIAYIEPYFSIGGGIAKTESNSYLAVVPGIGLRVFFREWLSMRLDFKDYIFTETSTDRALSTAGNIVTRSSLTNNYTVMLSLSFWLPKMPR